MGDYVQPNGLYDYKEMSFSQRFFGHLKTICKHKWYVGYYCFQAGLYWQGIVHDLSKFSPTEFWESVHYYSGKTSPINACKNDKGYSMSWIHHRGHNLHHREAWTDYYDKGTIALQMPFKYALESVCDYLGAGMAYQGKKFTYQSELRWWENECSQPMCIHKQTKYFIDDMLKIMAKENSCDVLRQERAKEVYKYAEIEAQLGRLEME